MITIRIDQKAPSLLAVSFPKDSLGNELIAQVPGRRFSYTRQGWTVPNTRESVVKLGQLFGKEYCRFDETIVRLYKPTATPAEVEQATGTPDRNPPKPSMSQHRLINSGATSSLFIM